MEKISRRINELETIHSNVKLLSEMVEQYNSQTTDSEREMMKVSTRNIPKFQTHDFGHISTCGK